MSRKSNFIQAGLPPVVAVQPSSGKSQAKRNARIVRKPAISLIAAISRDRIIGFSNRLPWHLPEDLRHFRRLTIHRTILMGRKTFESIGRPLPQRRNIVITRRTNANFPKNIELAESLSQALEICQKDRRVIVIGGGEIFNEALPIADRIHLTIVYLEEHQKSLFGPFLGDRFFPFISPKEWKIARLGSRRRAKIRRDAGNRPPQIGYLNNVFFRFIDLVRTRAPSVTASGDENGDFHWSTFDRLSPKTI